MANYVKHPKIIIGQKFGKLIIIDSAEPKIYPNGKIHRQCLCQCDCGNQTIVSYNHLQQNDTKSCGCLKRKNLASGLHRTHGLRHTNTYNIWALMKDRCYNPNRPEYNHYGGRGIKVCDRWLESFENFLEDMGHCPSDLWLGRINNNGNYEKDNCEWQTPLQQANNTRKNVYIEWQGKRMTISEAARAVGLKYHTVYMRLSKYGWSIEEALTTPV